MPLLLGLLIFSFCVTAAGLVPFINLLYKLRFTRRVQQTKDAFDRPTPIFDKYHHHKKGTPVGGGLLVIGIVSLLFFLLFPLAKYLGVFVTHVYPVNEEVHVIFLTFLSFGLLGLYDDIMKFFKFDRNGWVGVRLNHQVLNTRVFGLVNVALRYFNF